MRYVFIWTIVIFCFSCIYRVQAQETLLSISDTCLTRQQINRIANVLIVTQHDVELLKSKNSNLNSQLELYRMWAKSDSLQSEIIVKQHSMLVETLQVKDNEISRLKRYTTLKTILGTIGALTIATLALNASM